jgi:antirestriction protein ArdC
MATATSEPTSSEPTNPGKRDFRREVTDSIIAMLETGVAPWQKPWESRKSLAMPTNPTTGRAYRGANAIHLMTMDLQRDYADPRWMTYRQAASQGWYVRRGEKGTQIEFWEVRNEPDRASEQTHAGGSEDPEPTSGLTPDAANRFIHRIYTVFNARQIEGVPVWTPRERTGFEIVHAAERILARSGAAIIHDQADRAFYNRSSDNIHLPSRDSFRDAAGYYSTALHELAHWTGHPSRLDRVTLNETYRFGDINYAKEELRAELASFFLAAERGIPHDPEQHAAYVDSWIKALRDDKHEIFRAAHDASRATDFLLALERDREIATELHSTRDAACSLQANSLRDAHAITARLIGDKAMTVSAAIDSGVYRGVIIGETEDHIVQRQTSGGAVARVKGRLARQPGQVENVVITYSNGSANVRRTRERTKTKELGR